MSIHTFAIGDIHGRADLLETMLKGIADVAEDQQIKHSVVFLGDVIDRGPDSKDAMEIVAQTLRADQGSQLILGNHDWFPIRILDELSGDQKDMALDHWIKVIGGDQTLMSYGFDPNSFTVADLEKHFPAHHLELFRTALPYVELPNHVLVHAGLAPGIPLSAQTRRDLMWIREPFLSTDALMEKVVVHGHTITSSHRCEVARHRIGIDTGAYSTGLLSAAHIAPNGTVKFLSVSSDHPRTTGYVDPVRLG